MTERFGRHNYLLMLMGIIFIAALVRFAAYPTVMMWDADAVARTWIAMDWLESPYVITSGTWGPGHTYFVALVILITGDAFIGPVIVNILLSIATAIVLYFITQTLFNNSKASLFVAAAYAFYPIAIRSSYVNMPESPSIFLLALVFYFLVRAKSEKGRISDAVLAGLFMTLTASMRFEIWFYIPFLGLILYKKYHFILAFWIAAMLFPLYWMANSYIDHGNILHSINQSREWELVIEDSDADLGVLDVIKRVLFYPASIVFGPTPIIALMIIGGIGLALYHRMPQSVWIIPPIILALLIIYNASGGALATKSRYTLPYMIFLYPFMALTFIMLSKYKWSTIVALIVVATIIPLSYIGNWGTPDLIRKFFEGDINAFPMIVDTDPESLNALSDAVGEQVDSQDAVISDFFGWPQTYYLIYRNTLEPDRIFVAPGAENQDLKEDRVRRVLSSHYRGVLIIQPGSRFAELIGFEPGSEQVELLGYSLQIEYIDTFRVRDMDIELYGFTII